MKWHEGPAVAFDTETTGPSPLDARIVTAAVVHLGPDGVRSTIQWIIDPGVDIPDGAAEVHGWTTDALRRYLDGWEAARITDNGRRQRLTADAAVFEMTAQLATAMGTETPLVVMNAAYDLTLAELECRRYDVDPLSTRPTGIVGIVDPMVVEKAFDPFRKVKGGCRGGKWSCGGCGVEDKRLESLCTHYGIVHGGAHDAAADCVAGYRIALRLAEAWPEMARWKLDTLHQHQVTWRREQADSLRAYFDRNGTEHDGIDPGWPVHTSLGKA